MCGGRPSMGWESGKTEPRPPEQEAYARLLEQLTKLYPASGGNGVPEEDTTVPQPTMVSAAQAAAAALDARVSPPTAPEGRASDAEADAEVSPSSPPAAVRAPAAVSRPRAEQAPHRPGGPVVRPEIRRVLRNTPASAARTTRGASSTRSSAEHPRVGGQDWFQQSP